MSTSHLYQITDLLEHDTAKQTEEEFFRTETSLDPALVVAIPTDYVLAPENSYTPDEIPDLLSGKPPGVHYIGDKVYVYYDNGMYGVYFKLIKG